MIGERWGSRCTFCTPISELAFLSMCPRDFSPVRRNCGEKLASSWLECRLNISPVLVWSGRIYPRSQGGDTLGETFSLESGEQPGKELELALTNRITRNPLLLANQIGFLITLLALSSSDLSDSRSFSLFCSKFAADGPNCRLSLQG